MTEFDSAALPHDFTNAGVILYESEGPGLHVTVTAEYGPDYSLRIEGYDRGDVVKALRGDWDYEYRLTLAVPEVDCLAQGLGLPPRQYRQLLTLLVMRFGGPMAFSGLKKFLDESSIGYQQTAWD